MFDIGWAELMIVAAVTIIVVGPKELPGLLRSFGNMVSKLRGMANEFKSHLNDVVEADEMKKLKDDIEGIKEANPLNEIKNTVEGKGEAGNSTTSNDDYGFDDFADNQSFHNTEVASSDVEPSKEGAVETEYPNNVEPIRKANEA